MTLDAMAHEPQFLDHLAPVWHALDPSIRGRFLVDPGLMERATGKGIDAEPVDWPRLPSQPPPRFDGPPMLLASYGDMKVGRRLGYGPFVFMEHGAGQSYAGDPRRPESVISGSYAGGPDRDDVALFLVPGEHPAKRWRDAYPNARVEIVGCPRLDSLPERVPNGDWPVIAISFHWDTPMRMGPEGQNALGEYLPALGPLADHYNVIGHAHPKGDWPERMRRIYDRYRIPFVRDFDDVCRRADVYVCDNSSTIYEFAATGRPVVLLNSQHYRRDIEHGIRFWDAAHVGVQCDRPADLLDAVELATADLPEQQRAREDALSIVYGVRTNGAAYAATAITEWLASRVEVAA